MVTKKNLKVLIQHSQGCSSEILQSFKSTSCQPFFFLSSQNYTSCTSSFPQVSWLCLFYIRVYLLTFLPKMAFPRKPTETLMAVEAWVGDFSINQQLAAGN